MNTRTSFVVAALAMTIAWLVSVNVLADTSKDKPNILLIVADAIVFIAPVLPEKRRGG